MATKRVADLAVGDEVMTVRTVKAAWENSSGTSMSIVFDDDSMQTFDLTGDPSIEVADG